MRVFISGSISIKKLPKYALHKIDNIIKKDYHVFVGDAKGVDSIVQKYLQKKNYQNVIVYYAGNEIRNNYGNWETKQVNNSSKKKGRELYTLKDIEMANDADFGLMIWDGKSEGTLNNISMMKLRNKRFFVVIDEMIIDEKRIDSFLNITKPQKQREDLQMEMF
ncbi:MAG: hypothetical protein WDA74_05500 [Spirochaetota bacterium]